MKERTFRDRLWRKAEGIIDPFGDVISECRTLGDDITTASLTPDKLTKSGGYRYIKARRPELYRDILGQEHKSEQKVVWL